MKRKTAGISRKQRLGNLNSKSISQSAASLCKYFRYESARKEREHVCVIVCSSRRKGKAPNQSVHAAAGSISSLNTSLPVSSQVSLR